MVVKDTLNVNVIVEKVKILYTGNILFPQLGFFNDRKYTDFRLTVNCKFIRRSNSEEDFSQILSCVGIKF